MTKRTIPMAVASVVVTAAVAATAYAATGSLRLGPAGRSSQTVYRAYYDGHKDTYLVTDVSNKAQAASLHINYSPSLARFKGAPNQWFVQGRAVAGQLAVFGSEPGESDYNPLWEEQIVTWKSGVKPVLLVKDDQIDSLEKAGKLTVRDTHIVLNAPITKIGK
jgi:hypothetical protein